MQHKEGRVQAKKKLGRYSQAGRARVVSLKTTRTEIEPTIFVSQRKRTTNPLKEEKENHGWLTSRKNGKEEEEKKSAWYIVIYYTALAGKRGS